MLSQSVSDVYLHKDRPVISESDANRPRLHFYCCHPILMTDNYKWVTQLGGHMKSLKALLTLLGEELSQFDVACHPR